MSIRFGNQQWLWLRLRYITLIQHFIWFLDIDEEEIWEDFVKMIADNVENHSLSAFNIAILLLSSVSKSEFHDEPNHSNISHLDQVGV